MGRLADEGVGALLEAGVLELPDGLGDDVVELDQHLHGDDAGGAVAAEDVHIGAGDDLVLERDLCLQHLGELVHHIDVLVVMPRIHPKPEDGAAARGLVKPELERRIDWICRHDSPFCEKNRRHEATIKLGFCQGMRLAILDEV